LIKFETAVIGEFRFRRKKKAAGVFSRPQGGPAKSKKKKPSGWLITMLYRLGVAGCSTRSILQSENIETRRQRNGANGYINE
jgi:hypothetical protein